jgi:hypothetical protein
MIKGGDWMYYSKNTAFHVGGAAVALIVPPILILETLSPAGRASGQA